MIDNDTRRRPVAATLPDWATLRRELRPGDLGEIASLHGRLYAAEHGNDAEFEAMVARSLASAVERGWPRTGGGLWVIEVAGEIRGCIAWTPEGGATGCLRWVLLAPELRGRGIGGAMIAEAVAGMRAAGCTRARLDTFSDLRAAGAIYRGHGFRVVSTDTGPRWGRESVDYQHYEADLTSAEG